jgi:hypothetical protein
VVPGQRSFNLEMAVPFDVLESMLAFCAGRSAVDGGH